MCLSKILLTTVFCFFSLGLLRAEDWPGFRGPTGMGVSTDKNLPLEWGGPKAKNILWKVELPPTIHKGEADHNQSSPTVVGEKVFITTAHWPTGADRKTQQPEHHVACYAARTGKLHWDIVVPPGPWTLGDLRGGYAAPTPAVANERVFAVFGSSVIHALDLDGRRLWSHIIRDHDKFDVALPVSPLVHKDTVLLLLDRKSPASAILALDSATGKVRWEKKRPDTQFSHMTPVFAQVGGKPQLLVCATRELQGIDPNNGEIIWSCKWGSSIWPVSSPVVTGGLIYAIGGRGGQSGAIVDPTGTGDVTSTHLKHKIGAMSQGLSSPLAFGDLVYRLTSPGVIRCIRMPDGEEIYKERLPGVNPSVSPFVSPEGRIYCASAGRTVVLQAGKELKVLAESDLGDPSNASAAVSNGKIFLKGRKFLYAIGNAD